MKTTIPITSKKKGALFGKIETKEEALKVIKDAGNGFYFLAILQIVVGYFIMGTNMIADGVVFVVCAFLLKKLKSRIVAIILLLLSVGALIVTGMNKFSGGSGGQNIFLAIIITWVSIRAVQATFGLKSLN